MANQRGQYGNRPVLLGQDPRPIYVQHDHQHEHHSSIGKWLIGAAVVGGGILFMRHQSQQISQLYKASGQPYQTFAGSLRETARTLPTRARAAYRGLTGRVRSTEPSADLAVSSAEPAHSVRRR